MVAWRFTRRVPRPAPLVWSLALSALVLAPGSSGGSGVLCGALAAQATGSALPVTPPTRLTPASSVSPLSGAAPAGGRAHHRAQVTYSNGLLTVHADNSSLNGILRSISQCTGMKITGGVADQRVYGSYGPAAPATVLATLIDGTGTNMLLQETAADQPAVLILTPRTGGASPPGPSAVAEDDPEESSNTGAAQPAPGVQPMQAGRGGQPTNIAPQGATPGDAGQANQTPVPQPLNGSAVTGPVPIPQPINNVNGSPNNVSPTASTYPTTNSVPSDTLPTPSTTPAASGIVDAPNPPAAGSDTDRLLRGGNTNNPGTTNISPDPTSTSTQPGATNTTTPVPTGAVQPGTDSTGTTAPPSPTPGSGALTPEQVFERLQQMNGSRAGTPPNQATPPQPTPQTPSNTPQ